MEVIHLTTTSRVENVEYSRLRVHRGQPLEPARTEVAIRCGRNDVLAIVDFVGIDQQAVTLQQRSDNIARHAQQLGGLHLIGLAIPLGIHHDAPFDVTQQMGAWLRKART